MQLSLPLDPGLLRVTTGMAVSIAAVAPAQQPATGPVNPAESDLGPARFIRHRTARRYVVRVDADGVVRVTIPRGGSRKEADAFLARQRQWVADQRARVVAPIIPPQDRAALRARAVRELPPRLLALACAHGSSVARISIRNQRTRWGSCGRNGHITLNWRLIAMPEWVADYVMIHELMHLQRMDHSPAYWALVAGACPRFPDARRWLRAHAGQLR